MKLSIIIPNYNGKDLLRKNLPLVLKAVKGAEVIVIDDGSTDGSAEIIAKHFPQIRLIKKEKNEGFAKACNTGVSEAGGEVIVLLNSDVWPEEKFLKPLLPHFKDEKVFAVSCLEINNGQTRGKAVGKFENGLVIHSEAPDKNPGPTFWAFGASAAFDRKKWIEIGGMDHLFRPAYWEDIDLSWRAWKRGWKVLFEPKSKVHHKPESTNISVFGKRNMKTISYKNQFLFVWKNIHDYKILLQHVCWLPILVIKALVSGNAMFIKGLLKALLQLPEALSLRRKENKFINKNDQEVLSIFS